MNEVKKIVVIGPESTGKSTLCELLAAHYNTAWCPEYAREYLLTHGVNYNYDDLLTIAEGQVALEEEYLATANRQSSIVSENSAGNTSTQSAIRNRQSVIFIDTDMYVMRVWCEYVYHRCHAYILKQIQERKYDLYLLCNTDLPWVADVLREYPDDASRIELYGIYKNLLINQSTPFVEISGGYDERLKKAVTAVDAFLGHG